MMPSASPKQRVLIVGAKFGEMYLNAFMQPPEGLELVGLLAQGSARSRELAHAFGIPLYTSPEQITRMPDIACIVVRSTVAGGTGTQLARHFLTRGVHVIQEHPLHPAGAGTGLLLLGKHVLSAYARGTHMASRCAAAASLPG